MPIAKGERRMRRGLAIMVVLLAGLAVLVPALLTNGSAPPATSGPAAGAAPATDWPIFRGGTGMLGVAAGKLPEAPKLLWQFKTNAAVASSPVVAGGRVYVGSMDANAYCVDLATGRKLWSYRTKDAVDAPPTVVGGSVYVGSSDSFLYALDAATGTLRWKVETEDKILGAANTFADPKTGKPRIVVGSYDYNLYCIDPETGKVLWKYESGNYINGGIAVSGGRTVFGGCDAVIHVVPPDGKKAEQINAGAYIAATPAFDGKRVYVGNYEGALVCADLQTAKLAWTFQRDQPFVSSPAVTEDRVVAGCRDGSVYCLDRKTGQRLWAFRTKAEVDSSPVVCGGRIVFGSNDGRLYVVALADGKKLWSYELGDAIASSPAVASGRIVIGCNDGSLYCFGSKP